MIHKSIHGYTVKRLLGTGGMADIYYAENSLGKGAAVKVLKLKYSDEQLVHDRFISEAKTTVKLHHPNIRKVYDLGEIEGRPAILMEYLEGHSLQEVLRDQGKVDEKIALQWFQQIESGLQYAHKRGVIHRDIKPSNLFLTTDGRIKILDFGISKVKENITMTQTGQTLGTLTYMSPEQVMDPKRVDERTDIYSLGVTFYHLLTGKMPYDITTDSGYVIHKKIVEEELDLENLSVEWKERLGGCLSKEVGKRKWGIFQASEDQDKAGRDPGQMANVPDENTLVATISKAEKIPKRTTRLSWGSLAQLNVLHLVLLVLIPLLGWGVWKGMTRVVVSKYEIRMAAVPYMDQDTRLWGVKSNGDILLEPTYHFIHSFSGGMAKVEVSGLFGFIDSLGHEVTPVEYDYVWDFSEGLAKVRRDGRFGFVDLSGNEVVPIKYDNAWDFSEGLAKVTLNERNSFVDRTGKDVVPIKYDNTWNFSEGFINVKLNGKWGFVDRTGKEVIPIRYDYVRSFSEGMAMVGLNRKDGFIDRMGKEVFPIKYDVTGDFSEGLASVKLDGKWGFVDQTGKEVIPMKYDYVYSFSEGLAMVGLNGKGGYIDRTGKEVIPVKYNLQSTVFRGGLEVALLNNKWGFVDRKGNEVIPIKYDTPFGFIPYFSEGLVGMPLNGKLGFVDKTGKEVIPMKYDFPFGFTPLFSEGLVNVRLNGKWGFVDRTGKDVISMKYGEAGRFSEGLAMVELNGKVGFIDQTGKEVISMKYERGGRFSEGLAMVGLNGKVGLVDRMGKVVIPIKYDYNYTGSEKI